MAKRISGKKGSEDGYDGGHGVPEDGFRELQSKKDKKRRRREREQDKRKKREEAEYDDDEFMFDE